MPLRFPGPGRVAVLAGALSAALNLTAAAHGQTRTARALPQSGPSALQPVPVVNGGATAGPAVDPQPIVQRITLDEATQRIVANSKLLGLVKADLAYRTAHAQLMALIGQP